MQIKNYILYLKQDYSFVKLDNSFETLNAGDLLYSQDNSWTVEQIAEAKEKGFPYVWGFGQVEHIPFHKLQYGKVETFKL